MEGGIAAASGEIVRLRQVDSIEIVKTSSVEGDHIDRSCAGEVGAVEPRGIRPSSTGLRPEIQHCLN